MQQESEYLDGAAYRTTDFEYDDLDRLVKVEAPAALHVDGSTSRPTTETAYDLVGNTLRQTDPQGNVTSFEYDAAYRLTKQIAPDPVDGGGDAGPESLYAYDAAGQAARETDAAGRVTQKFYDLPGRLVKLVEPEPPGAELGPITQYGFDLAGSLVTTTRINNDSGQIQTTTYSYDRLLRRTGVTDENLDFTDYRHDLAGNEVYLRDAAGNVTTYEYDAWDRATFDRITVDGVEEEREYAYDAVGNLLYQADRNEREYDYTYDASNRRTSEVWSEGGLVVNTINTHHDFLGRVHSTEDAFSKYSYTYDELDRTLTTSNAGTPGSPTVVLTNKYDENNRLREQSASVGGNADFKTTYEYDGRNNLIELVQEGDGGNAVAYKRVGLEYDDADQYVSVNRFTGGAQNDLVLVSEYFYDLDDRLEELRHSSAVGGGVGAALVDYVWTYDQANRVKTFTSNRDGTATYSYDQRDQLTDAAYDGSSGFEGDLYDLLVEGYTYDENGNRTDGGFTTPEGSHNRLQTDGEFTYEYDAQGNRTKRTRVVSGPADDYITEYEWDVRNRLTEVRFEDFAGAVTKTVQYVYDLHHRRIAKEVWNGPATGDPDSHKRYAWSGGNVVLDFADGADAGADIDGSELSARYLWGAKVDELFAQEDVDDILQAGDVRWPLADNLGTIRDLAAEDGQTIDEHYVYKSFGELIAAVDSSGVDLPSGPSTRYLYTTQEYDFDVDLQYSDRRWYDTGTHTWVSADWVPDDPENTYRYVGNSPTNGTDPSGLADRKPMYPELANQWWNDGTWDDDINPVSWYLTQTYLGDSAGNFASSLYYSIEDVFMSRDAKDMSVRAIAEGSEDINAYAATNKLTPTTLTAIAGLANLNLEFYGLAAGAARPLGGIPSARLAGILDDSAGARTVATRNSRGFINSILGRAVKHGVIEDFVSETIAVGTKRSPTAEWQELYRRISSHTDLVREVELTKTNPFGKTYREKTQVGLTVEFVERVEDAKYIGSLKHEWERHTAKVVVRDGQLNKGVLAEEVQHALDSQCGLWKAHERLRDAKFRKYSKDVANDWWHVGVFRRIAAQTVAAPRSVHREFLSAEDAVKFKNAADEIETGLPKELQEAWDIFGNRRKWPCKKSCVS